MRVIVYGLLTLLVLIQYPLWLGKGGWLHAYDLDKKVELQSLKNQQLELRNAKLEGEVNDLKDGTRAIEERARIEHGMVKENEILVQILNDNEVANKSSKQAKTADKVTDKEGATQSPQVSATDAQATSTAPVKKSTDKISQ